MLLVIFDTEFDHVNFNSPNNLKWILDFTYLCQKEGFREDIELITPNKIDNGNMHKRAVSNYVEVVSKISNSRLSNGNKLRSIEFEEFAIYWLTKISIKHAQQSICKNVFYLFELLQNSTLANYQIKEVIISLPKKEYYYDNILKRELNKRFKIKSSFILYPKLKPMYEGWSDRAFLKNLFVTIIKGSVHCKQYKSMSAPIAKFSFFTFPFSTWVDDGSYDYVYKDSIEYLRKNSPVNYIPYFVSPEVLFKTKTWNSSWEQEFFKYYPSRLQAIKFCLKLKSVINKVKRISLADNENDFIDDKLIKLEMLNVLYFNNWLLFYRIWLKNFIKGELKTKRNFVYQDEFYDGGRILSSLGTKSNPFFKTYGFQHGLFFSGHTVYRVTDNEVYGENSMPIPNRFIVWGKFFKEQFLKYNSIPAEYVIEGCNNKYYKKVEESKNGFEEISLQTNKTILVCTTVECDTSYILNLIFKYPKEIKGYKFIFRTHPLFDIKNFISGYLLKLNFSNFAFSSEKDVFDDIKKSDVMVSSNASTTFLDGMIGAIPVLNIVLPDYQIDDFNFEGLIHVRNNEEFIDGLHEVTSKPNSANNDLEEFIGKPSNLNLILNEN